VADGLERRVSSKITRLPADIREKLEDALQDTSISYLQLSEWLQEQGYNISQYAVYRHALRLRKAAQRIADALAKTKYITQLLEKTPDADYTKASRIIAMDGLLQKVSSAEDEFLEMPLDKAIRLIANLARTEIYDHEAKQKQKTKMELAFDGMASELAEKINADPVLRMEFQVVIDNARRRLFGDSP
jgi:cobalamin biosynthesis Mg chelatase CobN